MPYTGWDMNCHPPTCQHGAIIGDCNRCGAAAAGMSVEDYLNKRFPPPPDDVIVVERKQDE